MTYNRLLCSFKKYFFSGSLINNIIECVMNLQLQSIITIILKLLHSTPILLISSIIFFYVTMLTVFIIGHWVNLT